MSSVEIREWPFDKISLNNIENEFFLDYPVIYFLNNHTTVYIGETVAFRGVVS